MDQNREAESIRGIVQKVNEEKLRLESKKSIESSTGCDPFEVFDYLSLNIDENENAIITSNIPWWFKVLSPDCSKYEKIDIYEVFPYFEVFILEANEFWEKKEKGRFKSGMWIETLREGQEIALSAYAIFYNNEKFIFVSPVEEIDKEQVALQLAREQKLAYEKLEKAEQKLKILLEYKDKFVSIVSHDLRSPVAAVLGISDMLVNDKKELSKLDEFYIELIHDIKEEMLRLLDYNDKLYHWSNLELGNFKFVKENTSL